MRCAVKCSDFLAAFCKDGAWCTFEFSHGEVTNIVMGFLASVLMGTYIAKLPIARGCLIVTNTIGDPATAEFKDGSNKYLSFNFKFKDGSKTRDIGPSLNSVFHSTKPEFKDASFL